MWNKRLLRLRKLAYVAVRPRCWRGLALLTAPSIEHRRALAGLDVATVIDVGANKGQFSLLAADLFPAARIYAFEPMRAAADRFARLFAGVARVELHRVAIGAEKANAALHVADRDDSSSLLAFARQTDVFHTRQVGEERVAVDRLSAVVDQAKILPKALLKIDVQGFEREVLLGAAQLLPKIDYVFVECSYVELYKGQALASEIIALLAGHGFVLKGVFDQCADAEGTPIQADFLFARP